MQFHSLNDIVLTYSKKFSEMRFDENQIKNRNADSLGMNKELIDESIKLLDPRARNLYLKGRKNNPFATWAELLWVLGGDSHLAPVMTKFLPRCTDFSDDGKTWRGAYNERISKNNLLEHVMKMFLLDGINTRRACFSIWSPDMDSYDGIRRTLLESGCSSIDTKDIPCTSFLWFWVRDNKFNCKVSLRSNDLIWGLSSINVFEFTVIQEIIYESLKRVFIDLELGYYIHNPVSLHIYQKTDSQVLDIVKNYEDNMNRTTPLENFPVKVSRYYDLKTMFSLVYEFFSDTLVNLPDLLKRDHDKWILDEERYIEELPKLFSLVSDIFDKLSVQRERNSLFTYVFLPLLYILCNRLKTEHDKSVFFSSLDKEDFKNYISLDIMKLLKTRYLD